VRDMQIEVKDVDNKAPKLTVPPDVCVQAGALINESITAIDVPSKTGRVDPLTIYSFGNVYAMDTVYAVKQPYATFASIATNGWKWIEISGFKTLEDSNYSACSQRIKSCVTRVECFVGLESIYLCFAGC
jgi:hypothetical protein